MPQEIDFEGTHHVFPDDFTQQDISKALSMAHPRPSVNGAPKDAGFFATLFHDVGNAPTKLMDFISGHPVDDVKEAIKDSTAARQVHKQRAVEAYKQGDYKTAAEQAFFGSVPFMGPALGSAADEWQGGQPGQAAAHAVEILGPALIDPAMDAIDNPAVMSAARTTGVAAKGALKGAVKGATETGSRWGVPVPAPISGAAVGGIAARELGLPTEAGAIVGGAAPIIKGAYQGARQALRERAGITDPEVFTPRAAPAPTFKPPAQEPVMPPPPLNIPPPSAQTPMPAPPINMRPANQPPIIQPPPVNMRAPIQPTVMPPPPVNMPGPQSAATAPSMPAPPLGRFRSAPEPEAPNTVTSPETAPPAAVTDRSALNNMAHGAAARLGIDHDMLSNIARQRYKGTKSLTELSDKQMADLYSSMLTGDVPPVGKPLPLKSTGQPSTMSLEDQLAASIQATQKRGVKAAQPVEQPPDDITAYAKGGVIKRPHLLVDAATGKADGLMAEKGPEAIVPLSGSLKTSPESQKTMNIQVKQLASGNRRVVMFPHGTPMVAKPRGMKSYTDAHRNTFIYNPSLTNVDQIDSAVQNNALPALLGAADSGMGAPDKSRIQGQPVAVVARDQAGTPAQATATDAAHLPTALQQTAKLMPAEGSMDLESPEEAVAERTGKRDSSAVDAASGQDIIRGSTNIPLSPEGEHQAQQLGMRFRKKGFGRKRA